MTDDPNRRRQEDRERTLLEIQYGDAKSFVSDFALNISRGGMFISTPEPLEKGRQLSLRFTLPGSTVPLELMAEVMWVNPPSKNSQLIPGMGVAFTGISDEKRKDIERYLDLMKRPEDKPHA
ncbi:MAG: TIGR02266 family protein [Nitrospirae bacterium]|nr:TIGR02266 family protein [Nitrospirota bacterium]